MQLDGISNLFEENPFENLFEQIPDNAVPIMLYGKSANSVVLSWLDSIQMGPHSGFNVAPFYQKRPYKGKFTAICAIAFPSGNATSMFDSMFFTQTGFQNDTVPSASFNIDCANEYPFNVPGQLAWGTNVLIYQIPLFTESFNCNQDFSVYFFNDGFGNEDSFTIIWGFINYD